MTIWIYCQHCLVPTYRMKYKSWSVWGPLIRATKSYYSFQDRISGCRGNSLASHWPCVTQMHLLTYFSWWTLLPGWCSHHQSTTQSLHFSIDFIGWRLRRESTTNSMSWRINVCMGQRHHTSLTSSSSPRSSRLEVVFAQRHHHHWSSVVHGCQLTATELFRSPLPVSGTNYISRHVTSPLHRSWIFWQSSEDLSF